MRFTRVGAILVAVCLALGLPIVAGAQQASASTTIAQSTVYSEIQDLASLIPYVQSSLPTVQDLANDETNQMFGVAQNADLAYEVADPSGTGKTAYDNDVNAARTDAIAVQGYAAQIDEEINGYDPGKTGDTGASGDQQDGQALDTEVLDQTASDTITGSQTVNGRVLTGSQLATWDANEATMYDGQLNIYMSEIEAYVKSVGASPISAWKMTCFGISVLGFSVATVLTDGTAAGAAEWAIRAADVSCNVTALFQDP